MDGNIEFLRHTLATLAYRSGKALRGAPAEFAAYRAGADGRTAGEILAHMGDLLDWALSIVDSRETWQNSPPLRLDQGVARLFAALAALDARIANGTPLAVEPGRLFQAPIADALTHVGQLAMMRRMSGSPFKGENYFKADVTVGRVGTDQPPPRQEF